MARLLIIGKLDGQIVLATQIAQNNGASVAHCLDVESALKRLRSGKGADLAFIDVDLDVADFIARLQAERIHMTVIGCGIEADSRKAVEAIKAGAKEYVPLPPNEELIAAVIEAVANQKNSVIATSASMKQVITMCDQIAPSVASVLITGESGTGKEVIAKYLHEKSNRRGQKMVSVNCAAIPDNLLESELFGHEKGAFTGAVSRRIGKFEEANGSTLLLDEISEMDLRLQAKLLRAIQEKEIDRVGGSQPVPVDIRIIATSNRDLASYVKEGNFREDLFFRLNVIQLHLPPLRERKEDIAIFAQSFADKYTQLNCLAPKKVSDEAIAKLEKHSWPGNVRELENTMHRAVLLATTDEVTTDNIMLTPSAIDSNSISGAEQVMDDSDSSSADEGGGGNALVGKTVGEVEKELILGTLDHCLGNRTHAASILGISIRTLRNKLNEYKKEAVYS